MNKYRAWGQFPNINTLPQFDRSDSNEQKKAWLDDCNLFEQNKLLMDGCNPSSIHLFIHLFLSCLFISFTRSIDPELNKMEASCCNTAATL